jgi:hypothetical protein
MNIDKKLNNMKPKDTPLLVLGYIILGMFLLIPTKANADNTILINQAGNNLDLNILQQGYGNTVKNLQLTGKASLNGANMNLDIDMVGNLNDVGLWSSGSSQNIRGDIDGNSNDLFMDAHGNSVSLQADVIGDNNYAWLEAGGSSSHVSNAIQLYQAGDSHYAYLEVFTGTYNNIDAYQGNGQDDNHAYVLLGSGSDSNNLKVWQGKHADGSTDGDETGDHEAYWTVTGDNNVLASYQTDVNRGGGGGGGHHLANIITGDSNNVDHTQMGKAGHDGFIEISGDSNTVDLYQRGNGGVKWADIVLDGDGHTVDVNQRGTNYASAAIDLTYGTGPYNLNLTQNVTSASGSYSITGVCYNTAGCTVTVNGSN